jgi:sugar lactone lactonase YvrE
MASSDVKKYTITEPWLNTSCGLGEGPFWEESNNALRFVDIINKKLFFADLTKGESLLEEHQLDFSIGITADIEGNDDEFVFGGKLGYGIFTRKTGETRWIKKFWSDEERKEDGGGKPGVGKTREERMRSNDGAVDPKGRFFVGTMNDPLVVDGNLTDEGVLFRLDPDLSLHRVKDQITIPNGMSWADSDTKMHLTDSPTEKIFRYSYDASTGEIDFSSQQEFFTCPYEGGVPDGHCKDEEGNYWIACFGTGRVIRVDPQGKKLAEVEVPTRCVTCPVLCGTELVITTATEEEPEKFPWSTKYQGAIFKIDVGVRGMPKNKFRLDVKA